MLISDGGGGGGQILLKLIHGGGGASIRDTRVCISSMIPFNTISLISVPIGCAFVISMCYPSP